MNEFLDRAASDAGDPTNLPIFGAPSSDTIDVSTAPSAHALAGRLRAPQSAALDDVPTSDEAAEPRAGSGASRSGTLDWQLVAELRTQASDLLMASLGDERGQDVVAERERGRAIIHELLATTAADRIHDGEPAWTMEVQSRLAEAVYHALFGLGRLQPLRGRRLGGEHHHHRRRHGVPGEDRR